MDAKSNLPPGVTARDVEDDERQHCAGCGELFNGEPGEKICPRCANVDDQDE